MQTELPKWSRVTFLAFSAISSRRGTAAGDSRAPKSYRSSLSLAMALLTSATVYASGSNPFSAPRTLSRMSVPMFSM